MVLKMTISKAWAMDFVWSSVENFLLYAKFSLSGGIQHGVLNIREGNGELSFLPPVQFCICSRDSPVLTGYLFRQLPACVRGPNWKNVLRVSGVVRCVWRFANWKNVLCRKMHSRFADWKNVLCVLSNGQYFCGKIIS